MRSDNLDIQEALDKIKKTEVHLDQIRGSMIGGAVGDALGYPVEFWDERKIFSKYGYEGITDYKLTDGKALISDDTQMTLFTANGILVGDTRLCMRGIGGDPAMYMQNAYEDWLKTQESDIVSVNKHERYTKEGGFSWLLDVPQLYARRAPGMTCLSAIHERQNKHVGHDYTKSKINNSKGCGGIMRTAPVALKYRPHENCYETIERLDFTAANLAAITHSHPLGYMPSFVLNHVISRIITDSDKMTLKEIVIEARDAAQKYYADSEYIGDLVKIIDLAIELSEKKDADDLDNIHKLGEGWVAEETLAIALYCALKYQNDFSKAIITAVNHKGDSDSTGAVTGNIVGALVGYDAIDEKWKKDLELSDVILEIADDLCHGCQMSEYSRYYDAVWTLKYGGMHHKQNYTFFWMDDTENGEFSNWYRRDFIIDDFKYFCVEQYMMAQKAKTFHDAERYTKVLRANTPKECKDLGKQVFPFDSAEWSKVKYEVVKTANRAKYEQNPDLMKLLVNTGDSIMAEASPYDKIWGIGMDAKTAAVTDSADWNGQNLMGKILMELRSEFQRRINRQN